ncbi:MAG: stage II sporulation protein E [Candidatus Wallbacteria bacterium HGW-Wallbacteria-1]|uniref:Stage II sporulation protein E n=1 Tax=Candidatus Wallbacteria bacterium HGW-Wallbacteria-1 TaxID=2013854 RepID=A0A2N1PIB4_9BACT|nr:MAG: stage II sporulation protein E [Candidatus Wallbacteria bacterium HGW-Wallbacteria-1]
MSVEASFIEVDHCQIHKQGQFVCGDVFLSQKAQGDRVVSVLADGLGSGIKASVLASLTTTMAARFISSDIDITRAAEIIMETLPVCKERRIAYSTFTIVDMDRKGSTRIIEYDNPPYILLRDGKVLEISKQAVPLRSFNDRQTFLQYSSFHVHPGDRIVICSDGVPQSGMGIKPHPLGWGMDRVEEFLVSELACEPEISARLLARRVVHRALQKDEGKARDDTTCGVIYFREPRRTMVITGPPVSRERDSELARKAQEFSGKKIVCGGTTAGIIARELHADVKVDLTSLDPEVPPPSTMAGIDLVTEGTITLSNLCGLLEGDLAGGAMGQENRPGHPLRRNAAMRLATMLLDSDIIDFLVGTRINDAHQDPNLPRELEIRRNVVKRICRILEERHLKETRIKFI